MLKNIAFIVSFSLVLIGWVISFSTNQEKIRQLEKRCDEIHEEINRKSSDRYYGHQGRALESRVDKLENNLPPRWLMEQVKENKNDIKELHKYLRKYFPDWKYNESDR